MEEVSRYRWVDGWVVVVFFLDDGYGYFIIRCTAPLHHQTNMKYREYERRMTDSVTREGLGEIAGGG